jgi:Mrp family chromosome partitioning ATPase
MVDLSSQMAALALRLGPPPGVAARVVQFVAPSAGAGTSTVAREFARQMAKTAKKGVWLIELDLMKGEQQAFIDAERELYGRLGDPVRASPNGAMFFTVTPKIKTADGEPWSDVAYLAAQTVGASRWWVTRFRREALRPGQSAAILSDPAYWDALRPHADYVVIDAPSIDRSPAAIATAPFVDANVLVISSQTRDIPAATALRDDIRAAGGPCAGVVLTRAPKPPPGFLKAIFR